MSILPGLNLNHHASVTGASVLPRHLFSLDNTEVDKLHAPIRLAPTEGFRYTPVARVRVRVRVRVLVGQSCRLRCVQPSQCVVNR